MLRHTKNVLIVCYCHQPQSASGETDGSFQKIIKNQPSPSSQHPCRIGAKADLLQRLWVSKDNWTLKGWQTRRGGRVSSRNAPLKRDRVVEIRHLNIFRTQTSLLINVKVNWTVSKIRLLSRNRSQNYCKYIHLEKKTNFHDVCCDILQCVTIRPIFATNDCAADLFCTVLYIVTLMMPQEISVDKIRWNSEISVCFGVGDGVGLVINIANLLSLKAVGGGAHSVLIFTLR